MITKVHESSGHITNFDKQKIVNSLLKESKLIQKLGGNKKLSSKRANLIANDVEKIIEEHDVKYLSAPLIREIACTSMIHRSTEDNDMEEFRRIYTRVGLPVYDLFNIITKPEIENANLVDNAETAHKYVADKVLKEATLVLLPRYISEAHLSGDIHIHDLEYFMTRSFCIDGNTAIPVKNENFVSIVKPSILNFIENEYVPKNMLAFTPNGWRKISKFTRRKVQKDEMLYIRTSYGKTLKVTKEHRIPTYNKGIIKANELNIKDLVYTVNNCSCFNIHKETISSIDLIKELNDKVPIDLLENIFVRNLNTIFNKLSLSQIKLSKVLESLGVENSQLNWFNRGIMSISAFKKFCDFYKIENYNEVKIGTTGNDVEFSPIFNISSELVKILGFFVSDGNYREINGYSMAITGDDVVLDIEKYISKVFNYDTIIHGDGEITNIMGKEGKWKRAKQIVFSGKIAYLIFRYIFEIPRGSENKRLPNIVYNLNNELLHDFLSALFSGDGTCYYRQEKSDCSIIYSTTSEMLRQELSLLLISLGMNPKIFEYHRDENGYKIMYRIQLYGYKDIKRFSECAEFYNNNQLHINNFLNNVRKNNKKIKQEFVKEIISIEPSSEYVYDISLEKGNCEIDHTLFVSDGLLIHNCMDWDLRNFFFYGLDSSGINKTNVAGPAKNATVAILHAAKVLGSAQTNYAGGQGFYNFLTFISPYLKNLPEKEIRQLMQMFLYEISQTMVARGGQVVFSSIQLTPGVPNLWKNKPAIYAGEIHDDEPYGKFEMEVRIAFKTLMELMNEGDYNGRPFNFPKPEIGFMKEFMIPKEQDIYYNTDIPTYDELYDLVFKLTAKFGTPYFDNMIPQYRNHDEDTIACYQCCAYNFSTNQQTDDEFNNKLYFKNYIGFSMGAWQVVTINCPRLAYKSPTPELFIINWKEMVNLSIDIFKEKKKFMDIQLQAKRIPFAQQKPKNHERQSKYSLVDFDKLVWEIGLIGIDDVVKHYTGKSMHESVDSFELAQYLCLEMKSVVEQKAKETGMNLVLARTPAETTAQRFAVADLINPQYTDEAKNIVSGDLNKALELVNTTKNLPIYYTNGTHVPVSANCSLIDRLRIEEDFFDILDGGNIHHIFLTEYNSDYKGLKEFAMNIIKNTKIGYFDFTKILTACNECYHVEQGERQTCQNCGSKNVDYISRITGYMSNLKSWNEAKKQEFKDRKLYNLMR